MKPQQEKKKDLKITKTIQKRPLYTQPEKKVDFLQVQKYIKKFFKKISCNYCVIPYELCNLTSKIMGNPMPAEATIMNSLDNSSSLAMEAGGGVGGNGGVGGGPGGLSEPDQMNKSSLDKPIIGDSVTAITNQKNKVSVLYGFRCQELLSKIFKKVKVQKKSYDS